jgi:hypothetical protein
MGSGAFAFSGGGVLRSAGAFQPLRRAACTRDRIAHPAHENGSQESHPVPHGRRFLPCGKPREASVASPDVPELPLVQPKVNCGKQRPYRLAKGWTQVSPGRACESIESCVSLRFLFAAPRENVLRCVRNASPTRHLRAACDRLVCGRSAGACEHLRRHACLLSPGRKTPLSVGNVGYGRHVRGWRPPTSRHRRGLSASLPERDSSLDRTG